MPFAAVIVGLKPARLPPLNGGFRGIAVDHVQANHWAERAGINVGDIITHVNGKAVIDMQSPEEFIEPMKERPLRITVEIVTNPDQFREAIGQYDWAARFDAVKKAELAKSSIGGDTNAIFERVFKQDPVDVGKSPLFDATEWIDARSNPSKPRDTSGMSSGPQFIVVEKPVPAPQSKSSQVFSSLSAKSDFLPTPSLVTVTEKVSRKWTVLEPIRLYVNIVQGFDLPTKAGILETDHIIQPFSAEPYFELLIAEIPSETHPDDIPLEYILSTEPIEGDKTRAETAICDANQRWNFSTTLTLPERVHASSLKDFLLIGRLMDYRRLSPSRAMGLFAIRLDVMEIVNAEDEAKAKLLTLTSADPVAFDVTNTRVKASICILGKSFDVREEVTTPLPPKVVTPPSPILVLTNDPLQEIPSPQPEPVPPVSDSSMNSVPEVIPVDIPQTDHDDLTLTPFQRAYRKARAQARNGDFSSLHMQHYNIRN